MVKFSKQFEGQLVPEWKHAFVDYSLLKKDLKRMQNDQFQGTLITTLQTTRHDQHQSIAPSSYVSRCRLMLLKLSFFGSAKDHAGLIQVHRRLSRGEVYETDVTELETTAAREFFARLDEQLNKVNQFYKAKEEEFLHRGDSLRKQMHILLDLKARASSPSSLSGHHRAGDDPSISSSSAVEDESTRYVTSATDSEENESVSIRDTTDEQPPPPPPAISRALEGSGSFWRQCPETKSLGRSVSSSCQRKKSLKISIPLTTPCRTIDLLWDDLVAGHQHSKNKCDSGSLSINKTKLRHAEKMIKGALVELYKGLGYLTTYRNLNMMAFVKILKKFEKVSGKQVLSIYLRAVESSYFNSSDEALKLMDEVEDMFVRHFAGDNRRKAMKYLKPTQRKESHTVTFFIGLLTGCFVALFMGYCIMAHIAGMYTQRRDSIYMETVYPVFSMFSLMFLHLFLYGCNMVAWRKTRINYSFIFEFAPRRELKYRDVFLVCTASMAVIVGVMFAHLSLAVRGYHAAQAIPGFLLMGFLLVLFCPFNIVYRSSRFQFLRILRNIVLSPLYKVVMIDFFMADQLCSQVPMLRSLEYVACYYISGSYKTQEYGYCINTKHIRDLAYAVSFLPYYWRAMQCARRWFDEGDTGHLVNLGKYVSAMLAAGAKVAYEKDKSLGSLSILVIVSSSATLYQLYWDFVKDWGLLQPNSKNPWLRNELILKNKSTYYLSMGLNLVLRLAWLQTVIHPSFGSLDYRVTSFFLAALEVIRRGHWNFYRLENEHLNNAGKYRAVKTVPLPFHEADDED
ncbi:phosphate transporter PHO1-1-like [Oryza brachyantha]|uniref:SPX domain-containing protein n=1 Tax=Oryza brachyantha TaxID=4533 RepID=J3KVR3_ORYBR|nr:phosphate transporter PHO1-1-like [Oryza brachyantha]